jgi:hypothetical protein
MHESILAGGCFCGAVRYRVEGEPIVSGICHCRSCRRTASAPMLPFVTFSAAQFRFTDGTAAEFHSSPGVTRSFCNKCGSPLTYRNEMEPGQIDVMTCSLDEPEAFPPTHHIWTSHKLAWERIADGQRAYDQSRTDEQ